MGASLLKRVEVFGNLGYSVRGSLADAHRSSAPYKIRLPCRDALRQTAVSPEISFRVRRAPERGGKSSHGGWNRDRRVRPAFISRRRADRYSRPRWPDRHTRSHGNRAYAV